MKNQSSQELAKFKRFVLPTFTAEERADSLNLITKGRMRVKTDRILLDTKRREINSLEELAYSLFNPVEYNREYNPSELFRFHAIGKEWIKHFVIAFSLEEKWIHYYSWPRNKGYSGYLDLPKEKQIFPIEEAPDFQI